MEIIQERLEREYGLDILATAPSVEYHVTPTNGPMVTVDNPSDFPASGDIEKIEEQWMDISLFTPALYIRTILDLFTTRRGTLLMVNCFEADRVLFYFKDPL